ncbi:hypothetical protein RAK27_18650 [Carnobacterium maltaromaticum]|uniref:Uncharacterized protein n=1 Tax=Carnobacterium maltaromaticum TaxID=2751 RepID=A0AAW9K4F8_CARML|nr:hypothetical protein [Carnobacterium maltaromaticum]MDZ5760665.1 hypothetical protein [Carnobacterium maltaromaticum]
MIIYIAERYSENQSTGEVYYFYEQIELLTILRSQKELDDPHYRGTAIESFKNKNDWNPINWIPKKIGNDDSIDYIEEYRQFMSNLKPEYHQISVSLFLKIYPRLLQLEEVQKLSKL